MARADWMRETRARTLPGSVWKVERKRTVVDSVGSDSVKAVRPLDPRRSKLMFVYNNVLTDVVNRPSGTRTISERK